MHRDLFDIAIDQILGSDGDVRLALRTVLIQNLQLEAKLKALSDEMMISDSTGKGRQHIN